MHRQRPGAPTLQCSQPVRRSISSVGIVFVLEFAPFFLRASSLQKKYLFTHTRQSLANFLREIRGIVRRFGPLVDMAVGFQLWKGKTLVHRLRFIEPFVQIAIDEQFPTGPPANDGMLDYVAADGRGAVVRERVVPLRLLLQVVDVGKVVEKDATD